MVVVPPNAAATGGGVEVVRAHLARGRELLDVAMTVDAAGHDQPAGGVDVATSRRQRCGIAAMRPSRTPISVRTVSDAVTTVPLRTSDRRCSWDAAQCHNPAKHNRVTETMDIKGVFTIMPTPFTATGELDIREPRTPGRFPDRVRRLRARDPGVSGRSAQARVRRAPHRDRDRDRASRTAHPRLGGHPRAGHHRRHRAGARGGGAGRRRTVRGAHRRAQRRCPLRLLPVARRQREAARLHPRLPRSPRRGDRRGAGRELRQGRRRCRHQAGGAAGGHQAHTHSRPRGRAAARSSAASAARTSSRNSSAAPTAP